MERSEIKTETVPTFVISDEQAEALQRCSWTTLDDSHVVLPFYEFSIRVEPRARIVMPRLMAPETAAGFEKMLNEPGPHFVRARHAGFTIEKQRERMAETLRIARLDVRADQTNERVFSVVEFLSQSDNVLSGTYSVSLCNTETCCSRWYRDAGENVVVPDGRTTWGSFLEPEGASDDALAVRFAISFLLMLNNRSTRAVYEAPPTRQQRRHAFKTGIRVEQRIGVYIARERVERAVRDSLRGIGTYARAAHSVRAHLRHLSSGHLTKVRAHARGGKPTAIPIYDAKALEPIGEGLVGLGGPSG